MSEQEPEPALTEAEVAALDAEGTPEPQPQPEPHPEPEPEPEPGAEPPDSQAQIEKMAKSLDMLSKHVAKRVGEILGEDANEFEECELCTYWGTPGWRHKGALPEAVEDGLRVAMGDHALAEFKGDEFSRACEKCNGLGYVLTGSKVNGQESLPCLKCKGLGWVAVGNERASGVFVTPNGPAAGQPAPLVPAVPAAPESPEIIAARELLQHAGHMVIAPFVGAT